MNDYATHVFDLDGVLLRTNASKSDAFREAALPYGEEPARRLVEIHRTAGSATRRERWERFFSEILEREPEEGEIDRCYAECSERIALGAMVAEPVPGVREYLAGLPRPLCVTGVLTGEARAILEAHGLAAAFAGIYGGPRRKAEILKRLVNSGAIELPAVYYGDTRDDWESAKGAGLNFVFVRCDSEWAEYEDHLVWADRVIGDFRELVSEPIPGVEEDLPIRVRVDRDGYYELWGERVYLSRSMAGAEVTL